RPARRHRSGHGGRALADARPQSAHARRGRYRGAGRGDRAARVATARREVSGRAIPDPVAQRRLSMNRRAFLAGTAATAAAMATPLGGSTQMTASAQAPKKGGTLRFVPIGDLKILDPIWTTAYITRDHGYMVYDTLFANDANLQPRPQMVDKYTVSRDRMKWSFTLRDGLRFHDGAPVTAEDCVASLQRWGKRDALGRMLLAAIGKLQATDPKTFVLELKSPFGIVLEA